MNAPWCRSKECDYEFNIAIRTKFVEGKPYILPLLLEDFPFYKQFPIVNGVLCSTNGLPIKEADLNDATWSKIFKLVKFELSGEGATVPAPYIPPVAPSIGAPKETNGGFIPNKYGMVRFAHSNLFLTVQGGHTAGDGSLLQQWSDERSVHDWQVFIFIPADDGGYQIKVKGSGHLVTISGGGGSKSDDGASLQQWHADPSSATSQLWNVEVEDGKIAVRSVQHGTYLTVSGGATATEGGRLVQHYRRCDPFNRQAQLLTFLAEE